MFSCPFSADAKVAQVHGRPSGGSDPQGFLFLVALHGARAALSMFAGLDVSYLLVLHEKFGGHPFGPGQVLICSEGIHFYSDRLA
jgi:hypothetical protein